MTRTPPTEIVVCERSSFQLYAFQLNLNAVDDMLLLRVALVGVEVVRADDVDRGGRGASLHHVHYVVGVRDVEPEIVDETWASLSLSNYIKSFCIDNGGWVGTKCKACFLTLPSAGIWKLVDWDGSVLDQTDLMHKV